MSNILIIGANRGLGLEFVKQYSNTNHNIIATTRNKDSSKELNKINNIDIRINTHNKSRRIFIFKCHIIYKI